MRTASTSLIERLSWLIRLRWVAVAGVIATVLFASQALAIALPLVPLVTIIAILAAYNIIFFFMIEGIKKEERLRKSLLNNRITNAQIALDLSCLAALIYFSGGVENPFIFYFIFHIIIASILLPRRDSFLQATFAVLLFSLITGLEYFGVIRHYCLRGFVVHELYTNRMYIAGVSFVFVSTLYIAAYMATSISVTLRQREKSLEAANSLLTEKDRAKSEYVLRVTHDIKEHLAAVEGCIEPVTKGFAGTLNEQQTDLLTRAQLRVDKLLSFVKALLDISYIKLSRHVTMEQFSIKKAVDGAVAYVKGRADAKKITLTASIDTATDRMRGIYTYIEETIANLLANAIKYTPAGGAVKLRVTERDDSFLVHIEDTGIGIPADEIDRVFDEFYRARNAKKVEHTGTGLGLSIAKQVVERHQGRIWVESVEGTGTSFYIKLPK